MGESRYIYFKKFMVLKKNIVVGLFVFLVLVVLGFLFLREYYVPLEEREIAAIKGGKMKMLGGEIIEIDYNNNNLFIDTNPLGRSEKYIIYVDEKTEFLILAYPQIEKPEVQFIGGHPYFEDCGPGQCIEPRIPDKQVVSFEYLKSGAQIEAHFYKRLDVDGPDSDLLAKQIFIIE